MFDGLLSVTNEHARGCGEQPKEAPPPLQLSINGFTIWQETHAGLYCIAAARGAGESQARVADHTGR
jgi:hypothetical protein